MPDDTLSIDFAFSPFPVVSAPADEATVTSNTVFSYTTPADEMTALHSTAPVRIFTR